MAKISGLYLLRLSELMDTPRQPLTRCQQEKLLTKISKEVALGNSVINKGNYFEVTEPSGLVFVTRNFIHRMVLPKDGKK